MKGRWASGIEPRYFTWIIKGRLAVCERPGGYARNHRKIRRTEEITWIRENGFDRVVSLLASPHNLHAYEELSVKADHRPLRQADNEDAFLAGLLPDLSRWLAKPEVLLVHHEEFGDVIMGVLSAYLLYAGLLPNAPQAIVAAERLSGRPLGPVGREFVGRTAAMTERGALARPKARGA